MTLHHVIERDPRHAAAVRKLWAAVLVCGIREAIGFAVAHGGRRERGAARSSRQMRRARDWIGSRDFSEVCTLAGVCPRRAAAAVARLAAEADAGRLDPGALGLQVQSAAHGLKGPRPGPPDWVAPAMAKGRAA